MSTPQGAAAATADAFQTPQAAQFAGLLKEMTAAIEKVGGAMSQLEQRVQAKFADDAKQIAKLSDDVEKVRSGYLKRFEAIVQQHQRSGGAYRGPHLSAEHARQAGRFFMAVARKDHTRIEALHKEWSEAGLFGMEQAAVDPSTGPAGGYLLAEEMIEAIIRNVEQYGVFEADATIYPQGTQSSRINTRTGGLTVSYPDYGVVPTQSSPTFGQVKPELTMYSVYTLIDNNMFEDQLAIAIGDFVAMEMAWALAYAQDLNAFVGDGTTTYARVQGVFNRTGTYDLTAASGDNTFQEVIDESVVYLGQLFGGLPQWADDGNLRGYLHRTIMFQYMGLRDSQNRPLANLFLGADGRPAMTLLGYPVRITQVAPALSASAASTPMLVAANLRRGWALARHSRGVRFRTSEHYKFAENQTALVMDIRQDIVQTDANAQARLITNAA